MSTAAPQPEPQPGDLQPLLPSDPSTIAGYRLLGRLGAGGMGVVYLGRTAAGELAAVKVTRADQADQPDFRARFRREVEAARRVSSPWAVPVTGADPDAPEPWMATAFVAGPSLGEAVAAHGPLPERSVRLLGWSVARALAAVHAAGLVHRDVKPGNVLLAVDGPRLIDFGIARATGETALTATDMVVGTPGFLAPEQAEARTDAIGPPADVFALGCLLAYAATGRPPFGTGAVDALMYRTVHDEPDLTDVPEGLLDLVRACLAKDPAARPTAAEVGVQLVEDTPRGGAEWLPAPVVRTIAERSARMLALPEIDTTEPGTTPAPPPKSRRGFLLAAGGAVLALGGGGAVWAGFGDDRDTRGDGKKTTPPRTGWAIGVLADLSGPAKVIGQAQERGARLAVEQFNAREDKPFTLELKVVDDRGDAARAAERAKVLTTDPGVIAVLGATTDVVGLAVLPAFEEAGLPLITVSAGYNLLTLRADGSPPNNTVLRAIPSHIFAGSHLANATTLLPNLSRPGVLEDRTEDAYSWQVTGGVRFGYGQAGITPHYRVVPARATARDYRRVIGEMIEAGIDAYVHCGITDTAVLAARALTELGFKGPRFTGQAVFGPDFLARGGADAEGWFVCAPVADPATLKSAATFNAAHRKRYGAAPAYYAGESYDVVTMTIGQLAADAKAGRKPARKGLWAALRKQKYTGATGSLMFNETGELSPGGTYVYAVRNGAYQPVGAAPLLPNKPAQNEKKD
ncbi:bifunctional serine/threonine-protein kinase/ABC transporter substrate-binding protein [Streptomyces sp. TLI_105]|uniref:bifunctional serine/threonine-protein kinase/ABC transporter substrate-binding protein n=1 Tax=Streptomyces sp. TLI_105 TaxID=1881019 RepID=UPI00089AE470|nr:bifunctional serine/threonine-protein kinase/ABC transporter substrate-binding protein [Streptomyces sp. TLI_105]SEC74484.1 serine/threonine protein kinase /amino acid/amide ABC transporter substrate-binding protein, HAAT family [Streptomyces sp. TLI_105]